MKQAHKKRSPRATANSPPVLADMGKLLYKSGKLKLRRRLRDAYAMPTHSVHSRTLRKGFTRAIA